MSKNRKVLVLAIIGILVMLLGIIGVTYAWFSSTIEGDGANFNVTTAKVGPLTYTGTEITASGILPGWISEDADLKVEGTVTGEENVAYTCYIENTGSVTDVEYRISGDGAVDSTGGVWKDINDSILVSGVINNVNSIDEYKLAVRFKETGLDQNDQQGKTLSVSVTCEVVDASVDANIVAWTLNGETQTGEIPQKGSGYAVSNVSCTNGAVGSWDNNRWAVTIESIVNTPAKCTINFASEGIELYKQVLQDNAHIQTRSDFSTIYTESNNGDTIHKETYTQNETEYTTYYFAGNVTNNYIKLTNTDGSEMWWRIIRINEDNSVRLLYYGTNEEGIDMFTTIGQAFNTSYNNPSYVGYKYTVSAQHGLGTDSSMKTYLENWYTSNLASYDTYISRTAIYCNDRTIGSGSWNTGNTTFYYSGYTRLQTNKAPTYACSETSDKFTGSTVTGNGELGEKPIGLITADEVSYAGGLWNTQNINYYISEKATGAEYWWTMTPYHWYGGSHSDAFSVGGSISTGNLISYNVYNTFGVRPVISLKSCVTWSKGDGTSDSPYEVTIDSTCSNAEN